MEGGDRMGLEGQNQGRLMSVLWAMSEYQSVSGKGMALIRLLENLIRRASWRSEWEGKDDKKKGHKLRNFSSISKSPK